MSAVFLGVGLVVNFTPHWNPVLLITFFPAGVGLLMIGLGRPATIGVRDSSISYHPALGSAKTFPRSEVSRLVRVPGSRGLSRIVFRDQDNHNLVSCQESFSKGDVERLSQYLGAPLVWDFDRESAELKHSDVPATWEEVKTAMFNAGYDADMIAEAEKHMK